MFNIYISSHREITYSSLLFSGGEVQVKLNSAHLMNGETVTIEAHVHSPAKVMELALVVDALRRTYGKRLPINLIMPYLPYARQDRVMEPGESLSLRVFCDFINRLEFETVVVWDVHSDTALALLDNVKNVEQYQFIQRVPMAKINTVLVAPDAGAIKKVSKSAKAYGLEMVRADKTRSTKDGSITGTTVYSEHIGDKDFLMVDDICDGGRTFIELAKVLQPLTNGKVNLYVTHGIFSRGLLPLQQHIDHIYVSNLFEGVDANDSRLTVLNLRVGH